jgi:hypothetical protein
MKVQAVWIEAMWHIAAFLTNAILCANGYNPISKYFDLPPPTLEQFLVNQLPYIIDGIHGFLALFLATMDLVTYCFLVYVLHVVLYCLLTCCGS